MSIEKCFDEGTIQAFLDGELASDLSEKVACHVAMCDACATVLAFAEEESSLAFAALDLEFNALVPTERIRTRLFETIATEKKTFWQRIFGNGFSWSNPSIAAFASLLLVAGVFTTMFIVRENSIGGETIARNENSSSRTIQPVSVNSGEQKAPSINTAAAPAPVEDTITDTKMNVQRVAFKPKTENRFKFEKTNLVVDRNSSVVKNPQPSENLPVSNSEAFSGEESYIRTIATLKQTVDTQKDELMKPSSRVAFEKDMAVVNDAIRKMQVEVRKNPKNEAAKEVLRSSYQNKIDLLNSVAEKSELMATLRK